MAGWSVKVMVSSLPVHVEDISLLSNTQTLAQCGHHGQQTGAAENCMAAVDVCLHSDDVSVKRVRAQHMYVCASLYFIYSVKGVQKSPFCSSDFYAIFGSVYTK